MNGNDALYVSYDVMCGVVYGGDDVLYMSYGCVYGVVYGDGEDV